MAPAGDAALLRTAVVCASNMNRSMEAHRVFRLAGMDVRRGVTTLRRVSSFGVGQHVKLPGATQRTPNVYDFGTPYKHIYEDLKAKDPELYARNGLLPMLERNMALKEAPQRWQLNTKQFDVVVAFEERVFDQILEDMHLRGNRLFVPLLVINLDVRDNATEAGVAAPQALALCQSIQKLGEGWEGGLEGVLTAFEQQHKRRPLYAVCYY